MFDRFGFASVFPSCLDAEQAVATERTFRNYERLERIHGVLSFMIQCVPDVPSNDLPHPMNLALWRRYPNKRPLQYSLKAGSTKW